MNQLSSRLVPIFGPGPLSSAVAPETEWARLRLRVRQSGGVRHPVPVWSAPCSAAPLPKMSYGGQVIFRPRGPGDDGDGCRGLARRLELEEYEPKFRENRIGVDVLPSLTTEGHSQPPFRRFQLIEVGVVDLVPAHRVVELARDIDPHRAIFLAKIVRQIGPTHQIEPDKAPSRSSWGPGDNRLRLCCQGLDALNKVGVAKDALRFEKVQDLNK